MAIFTFVLGLLFVAGGAAWFVASVDLMPTEIGLLYALCGMLSLCAGGVTLAIGALIRRLGVVAAAIQTLQGHESLQGRLAEAEAALLREPEPASEEEPVAAAAADEPPGADEPPAAQAPAAAEEPPPAHAQVPLEALAAIEAEPVALAQEDAVNENRSGHLPTLTQIEHALVEPEAAPTLVGHYSAGGANYKIFSDGSIEAETEDGAFKFASMSDFKDYLAGARG
ncbi:MAG: hypothetical protein ABSC25_03325 [Roseiarcus sp.]|jgi:hypothetical protein